MIILPVHKTHFHSFTEDLFMNTTIFDLFTFNLSFHLLQYECNTLTTEDPRVYLTIKSHHWHAITKVFQTAQNFYHMLALQLILMFIFPLLNNGTRNPLDHFVGNTLKKTQHWTIYINKHGIVPIYEQLIYHFSCSITVFNSSILIATFIMSNMHSTGFSSYFLKYLITSLSAS